MRIPLSLRKLCVPVAVVHAFAINITTAQGPAPSPLTSAPSPPPANVPALAPQPGSAPELTKTDFETVLDALIPSQLRNRNIAGGVVSVVKDGQVLFQKGYGYADLERKKPVLPDQTLFRPGSVFTSDKDGVVQIEGMKNQTGELKRRARSLH
jgi:CubicO group peptidase (beta-lactamase class C family)